MFFSNSRLLGAWVGRWEQFKLEEKGRKGKGLAS